MSQQNKLRKSARTYLKMVRAKNFDSKETAKYLRSIYEEFGRSNARSEIERLKTCRKRAD